MIVHYLVSPVLLTFILWEGISIDLIINKFLALIALHVFCMNMETNHRKNMGLMDEDEH